jgi:hypothetical protein
MGVAPQPDRYRAAAAVSVPGGGQTQYATKRIKFLLAADCQNAFPMAAANLGCNDGRQIATTRPKLEEIRSILSPLRLFSRVK